MEPQEVGSSYQEVSSWWLGFEVYSLTLRLFCFLCDVQDMISSLMSPLPWKELNHPAFLTMIDCYLIKPWAKRNQSLFPQITSAMRFIIVMKKVTNSSNALYYHGPLCKFVERHCWCCYCVEWDCSTIYLRATLQQKAQWWTQWTQIQSYIRCFFSSHFINVALAK